MSGQVQFGKLSQLKSLELKKNPQAQNLQKELQSQLTIFQQAQQAYETAEQSGDSGTQGTSGAFAQAPMSVTELEHTMNEEQEKLEKLMASLEQASDKDNTRNQGENEDDKNKVKPKEFGSFMA